MRDTFRSRCKNSLQDLPKNWRPWKLEQNGSKPVPSRSLRFKRSKGLRLSLAILEELVLQVGGLRQIEASDGVLMAPAWQHRDLPSEKRPLFVTNKPGVRVWLEHCQITKRKTGMLDVLWNSGKRIRNSSLEEQSSHTRKFVYLYFGLS